MSKQSGAERKHRHGSGLWQGAAVVVAAATLMAGSQVADAGRPAASTPQVPTPAGVETSTSTHAASSSAVIPYAAPGTTTSTASSSPSSPSSPSSSAAAAASGLAAGGIPSVAKAAYDSAVATAPAECGIEWSLVAAIGRVESNHGRFAGAVLRTDGRSAPRIIGIPLDGTGTALIRDTDGGRLDGDTVFDRAVGPMQFIPSTWARYASDGDGDGSSDPFDIQDAARATARYLCAASGDLTTVNGQRRAVLAYNHSDSYVATVLTLAARYAGTPAPTVPTDVAPSPSEPPANPGPPPAVPPAAVPSSSAPPSTTSMTTSPPVTTSPPSTTPPTVTAPPSTTPPTVTAPPSTTPPTVTAPPSTTPPSTTPPTVTTPPTTTPPTVTTPPTTTPPTTTPPATTTPSTTTPSTTTPSTTTPTTTPPTVTTPPSTTPPAGTTPPSSTSPTVTTPPATTSGCPTPAVASLGTVDIRDGSADPSMATAVGARVVDAGGTVGVVSTTQDTTSGVLYPEGQNGVATALADALGLTDAAQVGDVDRVTVVVGAADAARLSCTD
ncbi:lytic murein transglycosylase [Geodermatophilus sp. URMC 61]|uniref:lytic murein transglycosylase n=1 Tax=Geodermatophilus sp. URMC 61 TaxID=3423411 RepID=UPI00406CC8B2